MCSPLSLLLILTVTRPPNHRGLPTGWEAVVGRVEAHQGAQTLPPGHEPGDIMLRAYIGAYEVMSPEFRQRLKRSCAYQKGEAQLAPEGREGDGVPEAGDEAPTDAAGV